MQEKSWADADDFLDADGADDDEFESGGEPDEAEGQTSSSSTVKPTFVASREDGALRPFTTQKWQQLPLEELWKRPSVRALERELLGKRRSSGGRRKKKKKGDGQ